jgi:hypothetical protein
MRRHIEKKLMNPILASLAAAFLLAAAAAPSAAGDVNIGVSVSGEVAPGVYGRVDIGNSRPVLVYQQPVVIVREARRVQPVYMHVPPGHAKNWRKHCHRYGACGTPVYFVRSAEYAPSYRHHHEERSHRRERDHHGHGHGHGHGKHKHHD